MCALQSARPQRRYPCGQQDLYTIAETGWQSYNQYLLRFENHSSRYTPLLSADQLAAIIAARQMPEEESREEVHKTLRLHLKGLSEECIISWSNMETYIRDGFEENEFENKRLAAGYIHYVGATREDWDAVKGLMQCGLLFLNANGALLSAAGGMPATFVPAYEAAKDAFELKYQAFLQAEEQTRMQTDAKVLANNAIYKNLMKMFDDGKKIFRDDAAVREQFTFDRVWALVSGSGAASNDIPATVIQIGAFIYDEETGLPIHGGRLTIYNAPGGLTLSALSNEEGIVNMTVTGYEPHEVVQLQGDIFVEGYELEMGEGEATAGSLYSIDAGMNRLA